MKKLIIALLVIAPLACSKEEPKAKPAVAPERDKERLRNSPPFAKPKPTEKKWHEVIEGCSEVSRFWATRASFENEGPIPKLSIRFEEEGKNGEWKTYLRHTWILDNNLERVSPQKAVDIIQEGKGKAWISEYSSLNGEVTLIMIRGKKQ